MIEATEVQEGVLVVATKDCIGIPDGTIGVIDSVYGKPGDVPGLLFCVAWNIKENPLPRGYRRLGDEKRLGSAALPTRTAIAFDKGRSCVSLYRREVGT